MPNGVAGAVTVKSDEFIREVDEEVRRDRMQALWQRYGALAIAVVVAVVLGTAGGVGWRQYQESQQQQQALRYSEAEQLLLAGNEIDAAARFAEIAEGSGGVALLARLREAEALTRAGEHQAAQQALERLADAGGTDRVYRDLGHLLSQLRAIDGEAAAAADRLEAFAAPGQPWRHSARELGALAKLESGDVAGARRMLAELVDDPEAPGRLRRRAGELLDALGGPPAS